MDEKKEIIEENDDGPVYEVASVIGDVYHILRDIRIIAIAVFFAVIVVVSLQLFRTPKMEVQYTLSEERLEVIADTLREKMTYDFDGIREAIARLQDTSTTETAESVQPIVHGSVEDTVPADVEMPEQDVEEAGQEEGQPEEMSYSDKIKAALEGN